MPVVPVTLMAALDSAPKRPNMVQAKRSADSDSYDTVFDLNKVVPARDCPSLAKKRGLITKFLMMEVTMGS